MDLLKDAMSGLGSVLLPVAAGLLLEELTFAGLVRLLVARRPSSAEAGGAQAGACFGPARARRVQKERDGGGQTCLH
jgi:hypothetical protein